ncbi:hypothetical protein E4T80_11945 [Muribacter muris]|uniref:Uncharacterized protein n=1 Tax=Muribacter muris TaxID=67855 RepID=A0A4Y9JT69_9PAST|nr:hypothetical protein [Muribacter muris]MBF0786173.1 hypothetical protein [Muribacter muris]MBF0828296.1 hypothetical protein [Muribacter muris]TFV07697.1 hypothetical protein E4T80_11945 [Muribacter muris]
MQKFNLATLGYTAFALGLCLLIGSNLTSCQPYPIPTSNQSALPVQDNLEPEKIWTAADFKSAELDPLNVNYNLAGDYPPDNITDETVRLIREHNRKQLHRLTAGAVQ